MAESKVQRDSYKVGDKLRASDVKAIGRPLGALNGAYLQINVPKPIDEDVSGATLKINSGALYHENSITTLSAQTVTAQTLNKNVGAIEFVLPMTFQRNSVLLGDSISVEITFT